MKLSILAWNVHDENDKGREYGPFEFVQFTYELLRVQLVGTEDEEGEFEDEFAAYYDPEGEQDYWKFFEDDYIATDFSIGIVSDDWKPNNT